MTLLIAVAVFALIGAVLYNLDYAFGTGLYRRYYNATHGDKLAENAAKGFVYRQSARMRLGVASLGVGVFLILGYFSGAPIGAAGFFWGLVAVPSITGGFYLGPFLYEKWQKKNRVLDYLDRVDAGEADPLQDLKTGATRVGARISKGAAEFATRSVLKEERIAPPAAATAPVAKPVEPESPKEDPREAIRRFTGGR